jgi:hypothetical protein
VEHDNLYRRCIVHASTHLDANRCLAIAKHLFWWSHLVSYAIRSSYVDLSFGSCFSLTLGGRPDQHSTDENAGSGSQ